MKIRYKLVDSIVGGGCDLCFHPHTNIIRKMENAKYEVDLCVSIKNVPQFITFYSVSAREQAKKKKGQEDSLSFFFHFPPHNVESVSSPQAL